MSITKNFKGLSWLGLLLVAILAVFVLRQPALAVTAKHYDELKFPPLAEVQIPKYERYELKNGMVIYLAEDRRLPLIRGSAIVRTGDRLESSEKVGLAQITGRTIRIGGTSKHTADELNAMLEQKAASVETSIDTSAGGASFDTLSEDLDTVFNLFAEVLRYPAFAADKLELAKRQEKNNIARRNDDPSDIAGREFNKLIYGGDSPYGRTTEYQTIESISRSDAIAFYQKYFRPDNMILGIVGDFDAKKMKAAIDKVFGDWQVNAPKLKITIPSASQKDLGGVFMVNQPQLTQSSVLLGHIGGQLKDPDYPALEVLNEVLNGFSGRLFNELRSRQGLAYSVYAYWSPRYDYPGTFTAGGQTASNSTVPLVQGLLAEIEKIRENPIEPDELARAKDSILNSFVFNFQDTNQTISRLMRYEYYGYPKDFIFQYQDKVKTVTIEDVQKVAQQYLKPEQIVTLVVGNSKNMQPPLSSLGTQVRAVDITIANPKSS
ncbi:MAG: M16 family metallopeptidase [Xenococcaceae cyanobacterium]